MTLQSGISNAAYPVNHFSAQAGAPHMAMHDLGMAQATQNLWYNGALTQRSYFWPDPNTAPNSTSTGFSSGVAFGFDKTAIVYTTEMQIPWICQAGVTEIRALVTVAIEQGSPPIQLRMVTRQLATAVTNSNGEYTQPTSLSPPMNPPRSLWSLMTNGQRWLMYTLNVRSAKLSSSNMGSGTNIQRELAIMFQAKWKQNASFDPYANLTVKRNAKIYAMAIADVKPTIT